MLCTARRDKDGEDGASLLQPDELPLELLPGPASALVADCPHQLECSTRGLLEALPIKVVDSYGNLAEGTSFEVGRTDVLSQCIATWQQPNSQTPVMQFIAHLSVHNFTVISAERYIESQSNKVLKRHAAVAVPD